MCWRSSSFNVRGAQSGIELDVPSFHLVRIENGRVRRYRMFMDREIAIDWDSAQQAPSRGEVRHVGGSGFAPTPAPAPSGGDHLAELERLAKLRDSGALTDAEFEQEKAKILGS